MCALCVREKLVESNLLDQQDYIKLLAWADHLAIIGNWSSGELN